MQSGPGRRCDPAAAALGRRAVSITAAPLGDLEIFLPSRRWGGPAWPIVCPIHVQRAVATMGEIDPTVAHRGSSYPRRPVPSLGKSNSVTMASVSSVMCLWGSGARPSQDTYVAFYLIGPAGPNGADHAMARHGVQVVQPLGERMEAEIIFKHRSLGCRATK